MTETIYRSLSSHDVKQMDNRYRVMLINSLSGFKSANLLGTQDSRGTNNLAMISSVFHLGAEPALMGMIIRPHSARRDSLENLLETGHYTLNHVHPEMLLAAHQSSARYDADTCEFKAVGLTPQYSDSVKAPYVLESKIKFALELVETQRLAVNATELVVGRIIEIHLPENSIADDGHVHIETAHTVTVSGLDHYHVTDSLGRLAYAKTYKPPGPLVSKTD